ncbi:testis-expressed protein 26-like isoform X2 [Onychostoma macrolepis]|uniref:testis-expressed protein 26-like isoform X2 n=1 Tax=Onychostoma macrolepis TaxID=369639 RepID=UPI00272C919A|nr:testis-expressed protein 26-like isoform X2 [Onychostoma macrolepis]
MANYDVNRRWEPYETSHKRDFIYRPISSIPTLRPKTSGNIYRNSYTLDDPVGSTAYNEDFCWKPVSKTACIRSATASGNRRNNPHPSQAFIVWRHSADQMKCFSGRSPLQHPLTEKEIQKALSAQYRSTYRTDFLGLPQAFNRSHAVHNYTQTEMRHNYCPPKLKLELLGNNSRYGCNKLHGVAARGIVPTVIHSHINNLENSKLETTYNKHFGEKKDVKALHITSHSADGYKVKKKNGLLVQTPSTLERMSAWPGPL